MAATASLDAKSRPRALVSAISGGDRTPAARSRERGLINPVDIRHFSPMAVVSNDPETEFYTQLMAITVPLAWLTCFKSFSKQVLVS